MKFQIQYQGKALPVPSAALKVSGFQAGETAELHPLQDAVILLKQRMTAMELIQAIDGLQGLATELTVHLATLCGPRDEYEGANDLSDVPPFLLDILQESGACLGELNEMLMSGEIVYGEPPEK